MGTLEFPFRHVPTKLVSRCMQANQLGKSQYLIKEPNTWWQRLLGKHVIGEISGLNFAGDTVEATVNLTHPKRFDTAADFKLEIKNDLVQITQFSRVTIKVRTPPGL